MSKTPRVLILDDNPDVLKSLQRTLSRCGYDLTTVDNPQEAIDLLGNEPFDLLLSDIDMPFLDGHAVMERANALQPMMIRIFLTGTGNMGAAVRAINEGEVHRFVRKPFEAVELRRLLSEALERKSEIDIASEAKLRVGRKMEFHAQLEAEHPGITQIVRDDAGVYEVATESLEELAEALGLQELM